jgi:hypothetical protein
VISPEPTLLCAAGVDPGVADAGLLRLPASVLDLGDAIFGARDGAVRVGEVLKGDFAIFPGVGEDGVGWWIGHELFELHGGGVDEPHRDSIADGVRQEWQLRIDLRERNEQADEEFS